MTKRPTRGPSVPERPTASPPVAETPNPFGPPFSGPLGILPMPAAEPDNPFGSNPNVPLSLGAPPNSPISIASRRQYTGRRLVIMAQGASAEGRKLLQNKAGLRLHSADRAAIAAAADPQGSSALPTDEGVMFESLGVAVVNAAPDKTGLLGMLAVQEDSLASVEWERFVYASAIDASFLLGYRAGVDRLVEQLLTASGPEAAAAAAAASARADDGRFTWGLRALRVDACRFSGKNISVAVLDTGIDLTHPDFSGRVAGSASFVDGQEVQDGHGHGTHCAGIVCGPAVPSQLPRYAVAPDARLFVGKVLGNDGVGTDTSILGGIVWALEQKCDVISMSLGSPAIAGQPISPVFEQVGNRVLDAGSIILAAAGNDARRPGQLAPVSHPANCKSIAAVAAVDSQLNAAWFSNAGLVSEGGQIDVAGPGVDCLSTWPMPTGYRTESGTSMATPHVAGVTALLAEANPGIRGRALLNLLCQHAQRLQAASRDVGAGLAMAP